MTDSLKESLVRRTCSACDNPWYYYPGDIYCPLCGTKVPVVILSLPERPYLYEDHPAHASFAVRVRNVHTDEITVKAISSDPACFSMGSGPSDLMEIEPGAEIEVPVEYSRAALICDRFPCEVEVKVITESSRGGRHEDSIRTTILPLPEARIEASAPLIVPSVPEGDRATFPITVGFSANLPHLVTGISPGDDSSWVDTAKFQAGRNS